MSEWQNGYEAGLKANEGWVEEHTDKWARRLDALERLLRSARHHAVTEGDDSLLAAIHAALSPPVPEQQE